MGKKYSSDFYTVQNLLLLSHFRPLIVLLLKILPFNNIFLFILVFVIKICWNSAAFHDDNFHCRIAE